MSSASKKGTNQRCVNGPKSTFNVNISNAFLFIWIIWLMPHRTYAESCETIPFWLIHQHLMFLFWRMSQCKFFCSMTNKKVHNIDREFKESKKSHRCNSFRLEVYQCLWECHQVWVVYFRMLIAGSFHCNFWFTSKQKSETVRVNTEHIGCTLHTKLV